MVLYYMYRCNVLLLRSTVRTVAVQVLALVSVTMYERMYQKIERCEDNGEGGRYLQHLAC